jgi:hypothetical protein
MNKVFWQHNPGDMYLMGHKIVKNRVTKLDKNEKINKGEPIPNFDFFNRRECEYSWMLCDDDGFETEAISDGEEQIPF